MRVNLLVALLLVGCPKPTTLQAPSGTVARLGTVLQSATGEQPAPDDGRREGPCRRSSSAGASR
jgi:hypothetical protein